MKYQKYACLNNIYLKTSVDILAWIEKIIEEVFNLKESGLSFCCLITLARTLRRSRGHKFEKKKSKYHYLVMI